MPCMKIMFLNIWHAKLQNELREFLVEHQKTTDIFCFQEAYKDTYAFLSDLFSTYKGFNAGKVVTQTDQFDQVTYVRSDITVVSSEVLLSDIPNVGLGVYTKIGSETGKELHLCNFHGISRPVDKLDCPERLRQSQELLNYFRNLAGPKVIGGDFNLEKKTQSIEVFSQNGYTNLIDTHNIETTRNKYAWERFDVKHLFADYAFINSEAKLKDFVVLQNDVSDHLPLLLEIDF